MMIFVILTIIKNQFVQEIIFVIIVGINMKKKKNLKKNVVLNLIYVMKIFQKMIFLKKDVLIYGIMIQKIYQINVVKNIIIAVIIII